MAKSASTYKLDMKTVLGSIDNQDLDFYGKLTEEEQKAYSTFVIMRYMSSIANKHPLQTYAILATNDLVNIGYKELYKHPELQHKLLCCAGTGGKQYRPWIPVPKSKKTGHPVVKFLSQVYPAFNSTEIDLLFSNMDIADLEQLAVGQGLTEKEIRELIKSLETV